MEVIVLVSWFIIYLRDVQTFYIGLYTIHLLGTMDIPAGFRSLFLYEVFCRIMLTCDLPPPENGQISSREGPFQKENFIFQPVIF